MINCSIRMSQPPRQPKPAAGIGDRHIPLHPRLLASNHPHPTSPCLPRRPSRTPNGRSRVIPAYAKSKKKTVAVVTLKKDLDRSPVISISRLLRLRFPRSPIKVHAAAGPCDISQHEAVHRFSESGVQHPTGSQRRLGRCRSVGIVLMVVFGGADVAKHVVLVY